MPITPCELYSCECHDCEEARAAYLAAKTRSSGGHAMTNGKWSDTETPKRGWVCQSVYDNGDASDTCEMCDMQGVRYIHEMRHTRTGLVMKAGCICAGYMEGYFDGGQPSTNIEKELRSRSTRRLNWLTRAWKSTQKGNPKLKEKRKNIAVFPANGGYQFMIDGVYSTNTFGTEDEAKYGAFDHLYPSKITVV